MKELCDASEAGTANISITGFMDPKICLCLPTFGSMITRMYFAGNSGFWCVCVCVCVCVCDDFFFHCLFFV